MKNKTTNMTRTSLTIALSLSLFACGASDSEGNTTPYTALDTSHVPDEFQEFIGYNENSNAYFISCALDNCFAGVDSLGHLMPVTDNSGTAVYSGTIEADRTVSFRQFRTYSGSIDLRVNFSNRTFRENTTITAGLRSDNLNIRGAFSSNGSITGTATISGATGHLFGRIGADELTAACIGDGIACGFTAYRE